MKQRHVKIGTHGRGLYEISDRLRDAVAGAEVAVGLCHVFVHHTSASLIVCENADPTVQRDLERFMTRLVPDGDSLFEHTQEGPDDMPAHVRSVLTQSSLTLPVADGELMLGTWQGVFLWEHRYQGAQRRVTVTVSGES